MFQDSIEDFLSFPSCWKKEKTACDSNTQTSEVLLYEASCQSHDNKEKAIQTEEEKRDYCQRLVVDNSAELREFLKKVEPMVSKALKRNIKTHAFDGYKVHWDEETVSTSVIHTLQYLALSNDDYQCTGLSWNCTGSVIAVCYGKFNHDNWCDHKSAVCTWNIDRRNIDSMKPDTVTEIPTCLMSLSFHPSLPAIIATGAFDGQVHVLNTARETNPIIASSSSNEFGHKEPVAQLSWILTEQSRKHQLLSLGNDGMILVWTFEEKVGSQHCFKLTLCQGLSLKSTSIPNHLSVAKCNTTTELGGTCLSFSMEDSSVFVVGCENGSLVKCSLDDLSPISSDFQLPTSIRYAFKPHHGPVYSLSSCPFHRNLFISCGLDTTARLYSLLESTPLLMLEPGQSYLFAVKWSPTQPTVIALGTSLGQLLLYNIKTSHINPQISIQVCKKKPIYCIEYNLHRPKLLATGDGAGIIKVLRLGSEFTHHTNSETEFLASLAKETLNLVI